MSVGRHATPSDNLVERSRDQRQDIHKHHDGPGEPNPSARHPPRCRTHLLASVPQVGHGDIVQRLAQVLVFGSHGVCRVGSVQDVNDRLSTFEPVYASPKVAVVGSSLQRY
jgi:hypothetical protein